MNAAIDQLHSAPVTFIEPDAQHPGPQPGIALCLSGGGYRAMLFHLGGLIRLNQSGLLPKLDRVSSVSGGSITAAMLGLNWKVLEWDQRGVAQKLMEKVVTPVRNLAGRTIDAESIIAGIMNFGTISEKVAGAYDEYLFHGASLESLPSDSEGPRFVINCTSVQSGALWRFSKPYMADYQVGMVEKPKVKLSLAVAASSAFPPVLSPATLKLSPSDFTQDTKCPLQQEPYISEVVLTDGGVYDNLGLETAWKRYQTILVSDGGGKMSPEPEPKRDWARHAYRVLNIIDNQVRSLRVRQLITGFVDGTRKGTYWGIRSNISNYPIPDALPCPWEKTLALAATPTRLKRLEPDCQERLINWGYAVCDAALRSHCAEAFGSIGVQIELAPAFPYPNVLV